MLSYAEDNTDVPNNSSNSSSSSRRKSAGTAKGGKLPNAKNNNSGAGDPAFRHLPLSDSTLLVWVYRFDRDDPYRPVPNEAALQFAKPVSTTTEQQQQALDVEAIGRRSAEATVVGVQGGPRDTGLLAWLWGGDRGTGGEGSLGGAEGGVRQHFIGSAAWQGPSGNKGGQRREAEDEDIQRAIALSLAMGSGKKGGVEESKG